MRKFRSTSSCSGATANTPTTPCGSQERKGPPPSRRRLFTLERDYNAFSGGERLFILFGVSQGFYRSLPIELQEGLTARVFLLETPPGESRLELEREVLEILVSVAHALDHLGGFVGVFEDIGAIPDDTGIDDVFGVPLEFGPLLFERIHCTVGNLW